MFTGYLSNSNSLKKIILIYILNLSIWLIFILIKFFETKPLEVILTVLTTVQGLALIHVSFLLVAFLFFYITKHYEIYRVGGMRQLFNIFFKITILPLFLITAVLYAINKFNNNENFNVINSTAYNYSPISKNCYEQDFKIRGASIFGLNSNTEYKMSTIILNNVEWVALHPFVYQDNEDDIKIRSKKEYWSKRDSAYVKTINQLHSKDIHVMLKPHLWVSNGWRNNINFKDSKKWNSWFESYSKIILFYAKFAQDTNVELFCIGTELDKTLTDHSQHWLELIKEIKKIYNGQLTYAMNWDTEYFNPEFWSALEYIGIQAYYPLTTNEEPELSQIKNGWQKHITILKRASKQINKPILFTEIGYRDDSYATIKPWEWSNTIKRFFRKKSNKTQYFAFKAFFEEVWGESWFSGLFIWQWNKSSDFSIIDRPAQNLVMNEFSKLVRDNLNCN
ncbi:hypothetical protein N7U66_03505 [Lacinutrix neustonica]|uniref:Uncharacterized protein n=1 Tax=Lacinutrix neustonica TaxID=2980107 RepID=A0A9E8SHJ3_9FLAO|nr:hypothetical protein [Lacinutrix neustonica]WAC02750.1 hypothetical protein N7U66_03505 [Lacinutrix neustonica]